MRRITILIILLAVLWATTSTVMMQGQPVLVSVPNDYTLISEAIAAVPDGTLIRIQSGEYNENLIIEHPIKLLGERGAILRGAIDTPVITVQDTNDVLIEGLTIRDGTHGIYVTHSNHITIQNNVVENARLTGIKVRMAWANIMNNTVRNSLPPYGRGIHVTNTTQYPRSTIVGNRIFDNALSGIITNMTGMIVLDQNLIHGNGRGGIAITEMSQAIVKDNVVRDNFEVGIFVTDMSMADLCRNQVLNTSLSPDQVGTRVGHGVLIDFRAEVYLIDNHIEGNSGAAIAVMNNAFARIGNNTLESNSENIINITSTVEHQQPINPGCGES